MARTLSMNAAPVAEGSTTVTEQVSPVLDVEYGTVGSVRLLLDVYSRDVSAEVDAARAAIILIHGGGWFRGDKSKETSLASKLVDAGYLVFAVNYREAPDATFPASRDDVLAAAKWAEASDWAFDRSRVAFFGGSAGSQLLKPVKSVQVKTPLKTQVKK